jgi:hypothetical protein
MLLVLPGEIASRKDEHFGTHVHSAPCLPRVEHPHNTWYAYTTVNAAPEPDLYDHTLSFPGRLSFHPIDVTGSAKQPVRWQAYSEGEETHL